MRLNTVSQLSFRNQVTKFAVLLTNEPLVKENNLSKKGAAGIGKDLSYKNIITSVVCHNSHSETFQPIWDQTNGIQISINSNYEYYLEEFIKTVLRTDNRFQVVTQNALIPITLKETPRKNSKVDTDGDTIRDAKEIDWTLIKLEKGNLLLPTLKQCADYYGAKQPERFNRLVKEKKEVINSIVVLPITSDPASKDGDQDGYEDTIDKRPLESDVIVTKLKDDKFVPVEDGAIVYYGGNQRWYEDNDNTIGVNGGCGTVAASNMTAYLARQDKSLKGLYAYNTTKISKSDFLKHMNTMYQYVTPKSIFQQPLGVWPLCHLTKGVKKFAKARNITLKANNFNIWDYKKMANYVRTGLEKNSPVAIMIGVNSRLKNVHTYNPNGKDSFGDYNLHWVTITELIENRITDKTTVKVSSWGCYAYIDLHDYIYGDYIPTFSTYFTKP